MFLCRGWFCGIILCAPLLDTGSGFFYSVPRCELLGRFALPAVLQQGNQIDNVSALLPAVVRIAGLGKTPPVIAGNIDREIPALVPGLVRGQRTDRSCPVALELKSDVIAAENVR